MNKKICFIGHRNIYIYNEIRKKLYDTVAQEIKNGNKFFTMGTHGEFDNLALSVCRELKQIYKDIVIEVVFTSFKQINPQISKDLIWGNEKYLPYKDVNTVMYNIEEEHFKRKIIASNQQMINNCDILICYVDTEKTYGGAILAYKYAKKKGLQIINLFDNIY